jgi:8-oxo-dGTP diphosphatase
MKETRLMQTQPARSGQAPTHPVDVFLLLIDGDQILLALREGTGYRDGWWNVPSGKLEYQEDALAGVRREAFEEIGVQFAGDEPRFAGVVHHRNPEGQGRIAVVFTAAFDARRHGEPVNREPHKCAGLRWTAINDLPANTVPYTVASIAAWRNGSGLQISGWQ